MGLVITKILQNTFGNPDCKILVLGLRGSGKTSFLYSLNVGDIVQVPFGKQSTLEILKHKNSSFISLQTDNFYDSIDQISMNYFKGIIYLMDPSDECTIRRNAEAIEYLLDVKNKEGLPILIYGNKEDAYSPLFSKEAFDSLKIRQNSEMFFQNCSALTGHGIFDGLKWLIAKIAAKEEKN